VEIPVLAVVRLLGGARGTAVDFDAAVQFGVVTDMVPPPSLGVIPMLTDRR
jgi:hypothetical protein